MKEPGSKRYVTVIIVRVQDGEHSEGQNTITKIEDGQNHTDMSSSQEICCTIVAGVSFSLQF